MLQEEINRLLQSEILDLILASSMDGYCYTDAQGNVLYCNQAYYQMSGFKPGTIDGHNINDLVKEGYPVSELILRVTETQEAASQVIQYSPGGNEILVSATPVYDSHGQFIGTVENFRDLTALNDVRSSLEIIDLKYRMQLEQKEHLLDRMRAQLSGMEADMRNIGVVGKSHQMRNLIELAGRICNVNSTVLITGESGVGKDVFCRLVHHLSGSTEPYVKISCAAIPETLLESELFGYEPGAFTGASRQGKAGILEQAGSGIVFLDEIGTLPLRLQSKLLTLLQDRLYYRVGGVKKIPLKARIMAATNLDMKQAVEDGTFRGDLYYRLNVIPVQIPPLRERKEDIFPLVEQFLQNLNKTYNSKKVFSNDVLAAFKRYNWPGNVRELNNIVERMYVLSASDVIGVELLPSELFGPVERIHLAMAMGKNTSLKTSIEQIERILIADALQRDVTILSIAEDLGISISTLERKVKKYGLPLRYKKPDNSADSE